MWIAHSMGMEIGLANVSPCFARHETARPVSLHGIVDIPGCLGEDVVLIPPLNATGDRCPAVGEPRQGVVPKVTQRLETSYILGERSRNG